MRALSLTLLLVAAWAAGQEAKPTEGPAHLPPSIVPVKDARDVVTRRSELDTDGLSVFYKVSAPYPAEAVFGEIRSRLEGSNWKPLPRESINARYPSALKVGWRSHVVEHPTGESFVWNAQWSNPEGDVVAYTLMYKSGPPAPGRKDPKPDNDDLSVHAQLTKNRLVRVEDLPVSLIVLDSARDVSAWRSRAYDLVVFDGGGRVTGSRDKDRAPYRTTVVYTLAAPRPPAGVMSTLDARLAKQGWVTEAEKSPRLSMSPEKWALTHRPGWNAGPSGGYGGSQEWRSNWRNPSGDILVFVLTCDKDAPPGAAEAAASDAVDFHVEATIRPHSREDEPNGNTPRPATSRKPS